MIFDFDLLSKEFKMFYEAFSPETYGVSMGRAAEYAAIEFDSLSNEEKTLVNEWFLELFAEEKDYYGIPYFWVIEKLNDTRFIPLIKSYYKRLKKRHNKIVETNIDGKIIRARANFTSELVLCKKVIKALKHNNMNNKNNNETQIQYMPIFMCLSLSIGMAIGVAMDNIGVGMCLGVGIGTCLGALMDYKNNSPIKNIKPNFCTEEIYNIYSACMFNPTFEKFKTKAEEYQNNAATEIYGYFESNKIIGVIVTEESESQIEIIGIAVDNNKQKQGVGTKLIDFIRTKTKKQIFAETDTDAVGFYKKYGFSIEEKTVSKNDDTFTRYLCYLNN